MEDMKEKLVKMKDKLVRVCLCKGVSKNTLKEVISEGNVTIEDIAQKTGATLGGCKGARCRSKIEDLIKESQNN